MQQIVRGNTKTFKVRLKSADGSDYIMSSSDKAIFAIKKDGRAVEPMLVKKVLTAADQSEGGIIVKLLPEDTMRLEAGMYKYDFGVLIDGDFFTGRIIDTLEIIAAVGTKEDI